MGFNQGDYLKFNYPNYHTIGVLLRNKQCLLGIKPSDELYWGDGANFSACDSIELATLEEIEHLNACVVAGKYVDAPKWVPEVGDWVVRIKEKGGCHRIGRVFEIGSFTGRDVVEKNTSNVHCLTSVRKALEGEIPKEKTFKPSDTWEASEATCKRCANLYYHGSVNSGPHNLCEGIHCEDMEEIEFEENQSVITPKQNENGNTGKTIEVRTVNRSITVGSTSRGQSLQGSVCKARFGSIDKRYQA